MEYKLALARRGEERCKSASKANRGCTDGPKSKVKPEESTCTMEDSLKITGKQFRIRLKVPKFGGANVEKKHKIHYAMNSLSVTVSIIDYREELVVF